MRGKKKIREGVVVSDPTPQTVIVRVVRQFLHPQYGKVIQRVRRFHAHDPNERAHVGDRVRMVEMRPLSTRKRWRITEILEQARAKKLVSAEVPEEVLRSKKAVPSSVSESKVGEAPEAA